MRRRVAVVGLAAVLSLAFASQAIAFELKDLAVQFQNADESSAKEAGSHPFAITTTLAVDRIKVPEGPSCKRDSETPPGPLECELPSAQARDIQVALPAGFVGNQTAVPQCSGADFATIDKPTSQPACPDSTAIGVSGVQVEFDPIEVGQPFPYTYVPVYNLEPGPGSAAKFGFVVLNVPVTTEIKVSQSFPYNLVAHVENISQAVWFYGAQLTIWGNPASSVHDPIRGHCIDAITSSGEIKSLGSCDAGIDEEALITLPRSCSGTLSTSFSGFSWQNPLEVSTGTAQTEGMEGCDELGFDPEFGAQTTSEEPERPTGLDVAIDVEDQGLMEPDKKAKADIKKTVVTLPEGMTLNPSAGNGLEACSKAQFEAASLTSFGCPGASKIGTVDVATPLLDETLAGSLYVAQQDDPATPEKGAENPFDSLFAVYLVIRNEKLGVLVKQAGSVDIDEGNGRVATVFEDIPEFPLSHIGVHLRSGPRAPVLNPRDCGPYEIHADFIPSSGNPGTSSDATVAVSSGSTGACPTGAPPFDPGFGGGTASSAASSYSPLSMRITRAEGEGDITRFDATLPDGLVGKIAGVALCSDTEIAAAGGKTGRQELSSPSCPAGSEVGRVEAGAGVDPDLVYVSGRVYLAGPFAGATRSVVVITPAVAGPFDLGNVVVREALRLNPVTGQVEIDGAGSPPIPRMLEGIPLHLRDLRVFADRPNFTLNATSCDPMAIFGTIWGGQPAAAVGRSVHYQASGCGDLGFGPKLSLRLKGDTKRSGKPALHSVVTYPYPPGPGYSNIAKATVTLPPTEFIDSLHINNPCTRVQFNAGECPKGSILGRARAESPLLDQPLEGPVYFRSNGGERLLPDIVAHLKGEFEFVLVGWVDQRRKRLRTRFFNVPDVPVSKFVLDLKGGKEGPLENNRNLCRRPLRANLLLQAQNGKSREARPVVKTSCKSRAKKRRG